MRKLLSSLVYLIAIVAVSVSISYVLLKDKGQINGAIGSSAYERVSKTGVLRCGYVLFQPAVYMDVKTGKMVGFMVDIMEELTKRLGLKLVWAEEATFGTMFTGLEAGRYDAICSGSWISAGRSRVAEFTAPFLYSHVVAVVRADDTRFDQGISLANDPSMTLAVIDGDISHEIAQNSFPAAKIVSTPQAADSQQVYIDVISKKADMTFDEWTKIQLFSQSNPGKLRVVRTDAPVRVFPWGLAVDKGEHALESMLSSAFTELLYSGDIERMVRKNQPIQHSYYFFRPPIVAD